MLILFSPPLSPLLSGPSSTKPHHHRRLPPLHASASPSPEVLAKSALRRISDKLRNLGYLETAHEASSAAPAPAPTDDDDGPSPGEIFVPTPTQLPRHRVGSTLDPSWATGEGEAATPRRRRRGRDAAAPAPPSAAELALPRNELKRLQGIGIRLRNRLKIGKPGVTEGIVNGIHERWRNAEVVKLRCDDMSAMNMKRTHEILERKTGGLVIWRSGSTIILYRGNSYKYPYFHDREKRYDLKDESSEHNSSGDKDKDIDIVSIHEQSSSEDDADNHAEHDKIHEEAENVGIICRKHMSLGEEGKNYDIEPLEQSSITNRDANHPMLSSKWLAVDGQEMRLDIRPTEQNSNGTSNEQHSRLHRNTNVHPPSNDVARVRSTLVAGVGSPNKFRLQLAGEVKFAEEAGKLLDGLGPRFYDWWGYDPLPVDADLLPAIVPGFRRPFRLLPSGVAPKLTDREMTILRRLARPLPCHYALGRSRNLQGLAASIIKLWERCEVAKITIKRGAHNIDSKLISEELKGLTGGTILSRDNESIVLYRGKDFLPPAVSLSIEKRRKYSNSTISNPKPNIAEGVPIQDTSELKMASDTSELKMASHTPELKLACDTSELKMASDTPELKMACDTSELKMAGDTSELKMASDPSELKMASDTSVHEHECHEEQQKEISATKIRTLSLNTVSLETRLSQAVAEKERAEKLLEDLENASQPSKSETREAISEEERYMLRKVGLKMRPFLLLGRRGVFDGTVENMHLHWKYRELVKIICKEHSIEDVEFAAQTLEAESGGILVAVERVSKGHAIIVYRGKNYRRPSTLRPKSLLNKRDALKRSVDNQRYKSLKLHVLNLSKNIDYLRGQMDHSIAPSNQMNPGHENKGSHDLCANSRVLEEKREEVPVVAFDCSKPEVEEGISGETDRPLHLNQTGVPLDGMQKKLCFSNLKDDSSDSASPHLTVSSSAVSSDSLIKYKKYPSSPETRNSDGHSEGGSKDAETLKPRTKVDEQSARHLPFRVPTLTNRERLVLRKQALTMKKRPVLAIGRNNVITGVAKTIKTHFKKHPLAIVNIKNRADGTPIQQLISELEEATGSVLVSREPNKVILYRGWGAEVAQKSSVGNNTDGGEKEVISPQLLEAIRLECGLHPSESA